MTHEQPLDRLSERAEQLPRALQPDPALWERVEAQIATPTASPMAASGPLRPSRPALQWWPLAALTLLGVGIAALLFDSSPQPSVATAWQPNQLMQTQLHQLLDAQVDELPAEVRATVIDNLEIIASARAEIRQALEANPNSPLLHSLYLNSYANERALLKDIESMARQTKRRTQL